MSNRIETNRTNDGFSVKAAGVDIEKTLGTAAYREATTVIAGGKASLPTAGSVVTFLKELVADCSDFDDFKAKIEAL